MLEDVEKRMTVHIHGRVYSQNELIEEYAEVDVVIYYI